MESGQEEPRQAEEFVSQDLGDGYTAVPYDAVTINGHYIPTMASAFKPFDGPYALLIPKEGGGSAVAMNHDGNRSYRYMSLEAVVEDKARLAKIWADIKAKEAIKHPATPADMPDYEDLERWIKAAPLTWLPGLLGTSLTAADKRDVFKTGGMDKFLHRVLLQARDGLMPAKNYTLSAYLIAVFDSETHELTYSTIWSEPPWQQSMLPENSLCVVVFETHAGSYQEARDKMIKYVLREPHYQKAFGPMLISRFRDGNGPVDLTTKPPKPE